MVSKNESIFLGHTPADQRKYLTAVLKQFYDLGHSRIFLPAVGQFTLARCAIEAGFAKENIYTSDISLYSTLLGYYFAGRKVREIEFKVGDAWFDDYQLCQSDVERVAYLLWLMKVCQIRKVHYMKAQLEDLLINGEKHREILKGKVKAMKPYFAGVKYELQDMREVLTARYTHGDLVVVNPPVFSNGYTKMFDFGSDIEFDPNVPEFSFGKEYRDMYEQTLKSPAPFVWYRSRSVAGFDSEQVIYAKQYNVQKIDYWLCTKPELLKKLYESIEDVNQRMASGLTELDVAMDIPSINVDDLDVEFEFEPIYIMFMKSGSERFEQLIDRLVPEAKKYVADVDDFKHFVATVHKISRYEDIRNIAGVMSLMMDIVDVYYEQREKGEHDKPKKIKG